MTQNIRDLRYYACTSCCVYPTQGGSAEIDLKVGHILKLSIDEKYKEIGDKNIIYVDYKNIVKVCAPGDIVFVDDGLISLKVTDRNSTSLTTGKELSVSFLVQNM